MVRKYSNRFTCEVLETEKMSIKNKIVYEQSPWNRQHIEAINSRLKDRIVPDGQWHSYLHPNGEAWYRVVEMKYFQSVYAKKDNPILTSLMSLIPVETEDDAEWTIWKKKDGYAITSAFTLTPGPFNHTVDVARWLNRHALGFEEDKDGLKGVSYFADIEQGCVADAMLRLAWLEGVILTLNQKLEKTSMSFWAEIKVESDEVYNQNKHNIDTDEILPVPTTLRYYGSKYREPASEQ